MLREQTGTVSSMGCTKKDIDELVVIRVCTKNKAIASVKELIEWCAAKPRLLAWLAWEPFLSQQYCKTFCKIEGLVCVSAVKEGRTWFGVVRDRRSMCGSSSQRCNYHYKQGKDAWNLQIAPPATPLLCAQDSTIGLAEDQ